MSSKNNSNSLKKFKIKDICDVIKGTTPTMKAIPGKFPLVVTAENRKSNETYQINSSAVCIPLVSSTGHGHASINRIHFQEGKFALANIMVAIVPKNERVFAKYLYYLFDFKKNEYFVSLMKGTANVSLKVKDVENIIISLPDDAIQKRIVAKIEELFSLIDLAKDTLEKTQVLLKQYRQSILKHAFEGKLVPQDPNDEPASVLLEKIKKENPDKKFSDIVSEKELPKRWMYIEFKKSIKNIPLTGKKLKQKEYLQTGKFPVIDQGQNFIGGFTNKEDFLVECKLPVIIFGDHTKVIKFVNQEFVAGADGIKVLQPNSFFVPKLLYYFIHAMPLPNKGYARHFQYLEKSNIKLPPLNEQKRIVAKIEESFSLIEKNENIVESLLSENAQMKDSIFHKYFKNYL